MIGSGERHLWIWYTPFGLGGVETYLLNMARETIRDGPAVWVAATVDASGPLRELFADAGVQLLDWTGFHGAYMAKQPQEPFRRKLIDDLVRVRPTLIALNDCNDFSIGAAPLLRRLRPYCTVLDTLHIDPPDNQHLELRRTFLDVVDGTAATNRNVIDRFQRRFREIDETRVRYIANGVDVPDRERVPGDGTLRLLYVGRLAQDQKRILELPHLLARLQERGKAFTMTIVGDGPCRDLLSRDFARLGLDDRVRMTGYLPLRQATDLYFEHDALVNLSAFEGFSMSVLEAFATGCVPVCTAVASLDASVFEDGINCRLCPVETLDKMVDIWCELTPAALDRLSDAARMTGRRLTARNMYLEYRRYLVDLRDARPLQRWPADTAAALSFDWSLSQNNPWLARPHPLRKLAQAAWKRLDNALNSSRH